MKNFTKAQTCKALSLEILIILKQKDKKFLIFKHVRLQKNYNKNQNFKKNKELECNLLATIPPNRPHIEL